MQRAGPSNIFRVDGFGDELGPALPSQVKLPSLDFYADPGPDWKEVDDPFVRDINATNRNFGHNVDIDGDSAFVEDFEHTHFPIGIGVLTSGVNSI